MTVWTGKKMEKYIEQPPAISIQPNGIDIGVGKIWRFTDNYCFDIYKDRSVETGTLLLDRSPDSNARYKLSRGCYKMQLANVVKIPSRTIGLLFPRSSLLRNGILMFPTAIWESGYTGKGFASIFVTIKEFTFPVDFKLFQLVFMSAKDTVPYAGHYQGEGIDTSHYIMGNEVD